MSNILQVTGISLCYLQLCLSNLGYCHTSAQVITIRKHLNRSFSIISKHNQVRSVEEFTTSTEQTRVSFIKPAAQ